MAGGSDGRIPALKVKRKVESYTYNLSGCEEDDV